MPSARGSGYSNLFVEVDDFLRKSWEILPKQNFDVEAKLKEWIALLEKECVEKLGKFCRTMRGDSLVPVSMCG